MARHSFFCIDGHTCGNPAHLVAGGAPNLSGATMIEKRAHFLRENGRRASLIGWAHNIIILDYCKDDLEREFYMRMVQKYGWTKNALAINIEAV